MYFYCQYLHNFAIICAYIKSNTLSLAKSNRFFQKGNINYGVACAITFENRNARNYALFNLRSTLRENYEFSISRQYASNNNFTKVSIHN